jgi:hypothetical protein
VRAYRGYRGAGEFVPADDASQSDVAKAVLTAGLVYLPRTTRLAMGTLAALAGADVLQFAHAWLEKSPPPD